MNNNRSNYIIYSIIILTVCFYAFLTGCGSTSDDLVNNPSGPNSSDTNIEPITLPINITPEGTVNRTTSPTGKLVLEAPEANTYNSEVLLTITESPSVGNESSLLTIGSKIYTIKATRDGAPINLLNHPLNLTFSNEEKLDGAQNYYIGIKDINNNAWQFVNVYSVNATFRTALSSSSEFRYSLYKNNIHIALFSDVHKSLQGTPKVLDFTATFTPSVIKTKDSIYTEDLNVNILLKGENLSGLSADNYVVKVAYLSSNSQSTALKVDGRSVSYINGNSYNRYEAFGEGYARYFWFVPASTNYSSGFAPAISFTINLKDLPETDFSTDFILEISNADSKILPFVYSALLHFTRKIDSSSTDTNTGSNTNTDTGSRTNTESSTETTTDSNTDTNTNSDTNTGTNTGTSSDTGSDTETNTNSETNTNTGSNTNTNTETNTNSNTDTDTNTGSSTDTNTSTNTDTNTSSNTETDTGSSTGSTTDTGTETEPKATISLKSPATDFPVTSSKVELEFSKDIVWNDSEKTRITIDNNAVINDYSYSNKILSLTFRDKLAYNTTYVLKVTDMTGVENATLVFKTENVGTVSLKSAATDFLVSNNKIELEFSNNIPWSLADRNKISIDNNVVISDYTYSNKILSLILRQRLKYNTTYLIKVTELEGVENNTLVLKTENTSQVSLKSARENFPVTGVIELEFSKDIPITNDDISKILIDNNSVISGYSYSNKVLSLRIQDKLNYNTEYTILFSGFDAVLDNTTLKFKTQSLAITPVLSFADDNIKPKLNNRVVLKPNIYIDFGKPVANTSLALSNIKLNGADLPEGSSLDFEANMQNATLSFSNDLETFTDYTLSITSYSDDDKALINSVNLAFKTVPPVDIPGAGTIDDPFRIYCEDHLKKLSQTSPINYLMGNYFFKQMDDITLYSDWSPIGQEYVGSFNGKYDGNNMTISNIKIIDYQQQGASLFGNINNGSVSNLTLRNVDITSKYPTIAALCGYLANSIVENIKIEGNINLSSQWGNGNMGGLAAIANNSIIREVSITGNLNINKNNPDLGNTIGGLIGGISTYGEGTCEVSDCCVDSPDGEIEGTYYVGGLAGAVPGKAKITNSYARIKIQINNSYLGGLFGIVYGNFNTSIENCYSDCQMTVIPTDYTYQVGGLIGDIGKDSNISNCYASGSIFIDFNTANMIGVLVGQKKDDTAQINNSFSTVTISVKDSYAFNGNNTCYNPDAAGTPLWYNTDTDSYVYDSDGTNHCGSGYKTTLNWSTVYWFNLIEGGFPKLIGLPNR